VVHNDVNHLPCRYITGYHYSLLHKQNDLKHLIPAGVQSEFFLSSLLDRVEKMDFNDLQSELNRLLIAAQTNFVTQSGVALCSVRLVGCGLG
jgi:hypothetical protein